ncbi:UNVERIFIED_CONTAM: hypothetical protein NCL1_56244 [Trichonephila clavipes]
MFDYELKYLKGTNNVEADMLSRHPIAQYIQYSVYLLKLNEIKTHQNIDNINDPKYKKNDDVFVLKKKYLFKIVVPFSLRRKNLQNAHEQFEHPGTEKMIRICVKGPGAHTRLAEGGNEANLSRLERDPKKKEQLKDLCLIQHFNDK